MTEKNLIEVIESLLEADMTKKDDIKNPQEEELSKEELSAKQKKLDKDGDGEIGSDDLKKVRNESEEADDDAEEVSEGELPPALQKAIDKKKGEKSDDDESDDKEEAKEDVNVNIDDEGDDDEESDDEESDDEDEGDKEEMEEGKSVSLAGPGGKKVKATRDSKGNFQTEADDATADEKGQDKDDDGVDDSEEKDTDGDGDHDADDHVKEAKADMDEEEMEEEAVAGSDDQTSKPKAKSSPEAEADKEVAAEEAVPGADDATSKPKSGQESSKIDADKEEINKANELKAASGKSTFESADEEEMEEEKEEEAEIEEEKDEEAEIEEDFKVKAAIIFETSVNQKVGIINEQLQEEFDNKLAEEVEAMNNKIQEYVDYAVSEWIAENSLEIKYSLRTEIAENFIRGLQGLFEESYIDIPEEEISVVDELTESVESFKEQLEEQTSELAEARATILEFKRNEVVSEVSEDLTQTQAARLEQLSENVEAADLEEFKFKLEQLKEGFFDNSDEPVISSLTEEVFGGSEYLEEDDDSSVSQYAKFLSKTVLK